MDSSVFRGSVWIAAALLATVIIVGWAGSGGCAGASNAQLQSEVDALTQRVKTLEMRVRKIEGGGGAKAAKAKGKLPGKAKARPEGSKVPGAALEGKAKLEGKANKAKLGDKAKTRPAEPIGPEEPSEPSEEEAPEAPAEGEGTP